VPIDRTMVGRCDRGERNWCHLHRPGLHRGRAAGRLDHQGDRPL